MKALVSRWSPCTDTFLTSYMKLGISLCHVYRITRFSIVGEMYNDPYKQLYTGYKVPRIPPSTLPDLEAFN